MATTERLRAAGGTTKRYLAALGVGGWLKLGAVVLLFSIGASSGMNILGVLSPDPSAGAIDWQGLTGPAAIALAVVGVLSYIAAVADFVFVASLRSGRLPVRSYVKANLRRAGWLLAFRAAIALGAIAIVAGVVAATVGLPPSPTMEPSHVESLLIGLAAVVAAIGWLTVGTLTNAFVVPIMQYEHRGPLSSWRRFGRAIAGRWAAVAVFLLVAVVISTVVGIGLFILSFVIWFVGGLLLVGGGVLVVENAPALEPLVAVVLVATYLGYRYAVAVLRAPVRSYLRYYALLLLGDAEPALAMINDELTGGSDAADETAPDTPAGTDSEDTDTNDTTENSEHDDNTDTDEDDTPSNQ
ncbi:DUF7544 domain-containing protein [Halonotius roseus]|uniref:Uncharacterized protein n=1 Tax=Halonotius roseus TaxID=2511997 RepID=A0A544QPR1_9EURY|nr:hypothetical protein [Halonotius roseus]TQQ81435.1 hypothetical protein EWF95_00355 [Halonotius roseus]